MKKRHLVQFHHDDYRCRACHKRGDLAWAVQHVVRHQYDAHDDERKRR